MGFAGDSASLPASRGALGNPNGSDPKAAEAGGLLFAAMNCDGCHGAGATGFAAPSLSDGRWRYGGSDAELFQTISAGRPNGMPAFGKLLAPEIIWQLVSYLRSLPPPKNLPTTTW